MNEQQKPWAQTLVVEANTTTTDTWGKGSSGRGMGPTNQPHYVFMSHCWEPPASFSFSVAKANHQNPQVTDFQGLRVPVGTTFTSFVHCREAANTGRRWLFKQRLSQCTVP